MNAKELMRRARETNRTRDDSDRKRGFKTPAEFGTGELIRTAMCALVAGLTNEDWTCVAEATAMLEQLHLMVEGEYVRVPTT